MSLVSGHGYGLLFRRPHKNSCRLHNGAHFKHVGVGHQGLLPFYLCGHYYLVSCHERDFLLDDMLDRNRGLYLHLYGNLSATSQLRLIFTGTTELSSALKTIVNESPPQLPATTNPLAFASLANRPVK